MPPRGTKKCEQCSKLSTEEARQKPCWVEERQLCFKRRGWYLNRDFYNRNRRYKHGKTSKGSQRYFCPSCRQTNTLHLRSPLLPPSNQRRRCANCTAFPMPSVCSLRGISRISGLAYDTVVSIIQAAAEKAQMVHNASVQNVDTDAIAE